MQSRCAAATHSSNKKAEKRKHANNRPQNALPRGPEGHGPANVAITTADISYHLTWSSKPLVGQDYVNGDDGVGGVSLL